MCTNFPSKPKKDEATLKNTFADFGPDGEFVHSQNLFFKRLNGALPSRKCSIKVSLIKLDAFLNHISH